MMVGLRRRLVLLALPLALLAALLVARHYDPGGVLERLRLAVFDHYQRLAPREYQPTAVRIVDIDDESLARLKMQWPWPRTELAHLVQRLTQAGAAAIAFDIVFAEPDRTSPHQIARLWSKTHDLGALATRLTELADHDRLFGQAIAASGRVVTGFAATNASTGPLPPVKAGFATIGDDPHEFLPHFGGVVDNLAILDQSAAGVGKFSFVPDGDLGLRRVPMAVVIGEQIYPSLVAEAVRVAQGASTIVIRSSGASSQIAFGEHTGVNAVRVGEFTVPTDARGQLHIHFSPPVPQRYLPAWRVLAGEFDRSLIEGHIVLIGTSATGLRDIRPSPLDPVMPGVEGHAQALEQILLGHYLDRPDWIDGAEWLYLGVLGLALVIVLPTLGAMWSALFGLVATSGAVGVSWYAFVDHHLLVDPVTPTLLALMLYIAGSLAGYLRTEGERRKVRTAFSQYLAPAMVERVASDPSLLKLGGERRTMTFLFSDVRGFTTIAEGYRDDPHRLTDLINRLLTPMTEVVLAHQGTIDKYMGDCIMAFWNAPLDDPEHARHACESALEMLVRLDALNAELKAEWGDPATYKALHVGVGINTGDCIVGNMGSRQRFDYSVLGDAVNLASRLEGQSKSYGVDIVIGEATRTIVSDWAALELDLIRVKGKHLPERIHTVLGDQRQAIDPAFLALALRHDEMLRCYRAQAWDDAERLLAGCAAAAPRLEGLYALYGERIEYFRANPPPKDWDGVFTATSK